MQLLVGSWFYIKRKINFSYGRGAKWTPLGLSHLQRSACENNTLAKGNWVLCGQVKTMRDRRSEGGTDHCFHAICGRSNFSSKCLDAMPRICTRTLNPKYNCFACSASILTSAWTVCVRICVSTQEQSNAACYKVFVWHFCAYMAYTRYKLEVLSHYKRKNISISLSFARARTISLQR